MASFNDFQDQNWFNKRDEILKHANYTCEYCGEYNKDSKVHICYYPRGKRLWQFPDNAYKCYCPTHLPDRQSVEDKLKEVLANFNTDELDSIYSAITELSVFPKSKRAQFTEQLYADIKEQRRKLDTLQFYEEDEFEE